MLKKSIDAKVRPLANASLEKASLSTAARLFVSKDSLIALTGGLDNGKACIIEKVGDEAPLRREAALFVQNLSPNVVQMTRAFQDASGFKVGDQVRISLADSEMPEVDEVVIKDLSEVEKEDISHVKNHWEYAIGLLLDKAELVFPGMMLEKTIVTTLRRDFKVLSVNSQLNNLARFNVSTSKVRIISAGDQEPNHDGPGSGGGALVLQDVPGLSNQVKTINFNLKGFCRPFCVPGEHKSCGFVIHGSPGTGKTMLLKRLAATNWGRVHWIRPTDKLSTIREIFKQAVTQQPSMVLIDSLEKLIPHDRTNRDAVIETIADELDALSDIALAPEATALPRVLVVATCLDYMTGVPAELQKLSRLDENILLPIPRATDRLDILRSLSVPLRPGPEAEECLAAAAKKTHAYNGGDLERLVHNSLKALRKRLDEDGVDPEVTGEQQFVTPEDMEQAILMTRPTAMHDVNLNPPTVHWDDVGGQESLKKVLSRMIKHTTDPNPSGRRVLARPPKGLLLFGPPGCSKTLSAQAMATESSFNFFSVKGAELLNMYVGESERAVRSLFQRARAASPSIIFFDEIDSIGGERSPSSSSASRSSGSVNMLTTLLTEMDGFETLKGVLILAATNRPEAIDPALLRPGRFDQVLYVGPPDLKAREAVFSVHLRGLDLASDVDIPRLAALADGFSGAEITGICSQAGLTAQERYDEDEEGNTVLEIKMTDLEAALESTPRHITPFMLSGYEQWSKSRGIKLKIGD